MAIGGALGVVLQRNPFYSVLSLVVHLLALAVLFLLLSAEFIAAAQVIVYAGAVMVLYVFVVAYVGGLEDPLTEPNPTLRTVAPLFALALLGELCLTKFLVPFEVVSILLLVAAVGAVVLARREADAS